ncbi:hypothetical protein [Pseudomonas graminis]|uniref:hypothetical protein n=1 Tax=Pseudomonas graminis TaxID=158627 RepID=UPI001414F1D5|nr:hypothetical protein [Pseudomonas graminis]
MRAMVAAAVAAFTLALAGEFNSFNLGGAVQNSDLGFGAADTDISDGEDVVNCHHVALYDLHMALRA